MSTQIYEIYNARLPYKNSNDIRPVIVIEVLPTNNITVALISGAMDLYLGDSMHFLLSPKHPNFASTGLKKKCYIAGDQIYTVSSNVLLKKRGQLLGELAILFNQWI